MSDRPDNDVHDWLSAEAGGRDEEADALFAAVFARRVARLSPPSGFAARVSDALGRRDAPPFVPWRWRLATLALLVLGGLAVSAFCTTWVFDLAWAGWRGGPRALAAAATFYTAALEALVRGGAVTVSVARALWLAAASGPVAALLALNLLLALASSFALRRVLSFEEEAS